MAAPGAVARSRCRCSLAVHVMNVLTGNCVLYGIDSKCKLRAHNSAPEEGCINIANAD